MTINKMILLLILTIIITISTSAQEISIVLKNSKVIIGRVIEEKTDYILLDYELGQLRVDRQSIETISYSPYLSLAEQVDTSDENNNPTDQSKGFKFNIKDPVVIYLKNGNVVSGLLLAKSLNMVMLQTESGNLTIPKNDLSKIEYVSSEYAERGEVVIANLNNGQKFEGNIYFEDSNDLTLDTELGRLTLPKNKLRTIEYTGRSGYGELTIADQYANLTIDAINKRNILDRYDVFDLGYSSAFGSNFGPGYGLGYQSRFTFSRFEGMHLSAVSGLDLKYFALNTASNDLETLAGNLKGGAFIATLNFGGQLSIYPQQSSFYDFYLTPLLEAHYIYSNLEQEFPAFPLLNSKESKSEFKFGIGLKFGIEFLLSDFRLGVEYDLHEIFGSDGLNQISVSFVKQIF